VIGWFERLVDHLGWANRRTLEVVRTIGNDRARELLAHVLAAERVWLTRIRAGDSSSLEIWPNLDADECGRRLERNVEAFRRLLAEVESGDLTRGIEYANSSGQRFRTPLREILLHVTHHGAHHRGQIARAARRSGGEPVNTDLITFIRERSGESEREG
jgi:uncharacterized damage-inducible protein DinB